MASSSSSSSSSIPAKKYDVFLSFRGEDTRDSFTSHLHEALRRKKINLYTDHRLEKGDEISLALKRAIENSKISVIIFSENYATSTWCLDEVAHILSCREEGEGEGGQLVIPVFHCVDPSHVRKQQGSYAAAFAALQERFAERMDLVGRWRAALTATANLVGWSSSVTRPEATLVDAIVEDILRKLKRIPLYDECKGLVGMHKRIEKIELLLSIGSPDVRIIGIWGMGGIGKSTLARFVFNRLSFQFEASYFLPSIGRKWRKGHYDDYESEQLKFQLFSSLLDEETQSTGSSSISSFDMERLRRMKVLIVLDDVCDLAQLELLAGDDDCFGPGSRIIVTTRDRQLLKSRVDDDQIYKVEALYYDEAFQLFSSNAFRRKLSATDCVEQAKMVVDYAKGIPLVLTILGSFFGCLSKEKWKSALDKLRSIPNDKIQSALMLSYDGLDEMQKDIFLDIACFFEGDDRDFVERILDGCGFFASLGIDDLIDKSLITVNENKITMHELVQDMGQEIVRQQSLKEPGKRSRLWLAQDVYHVLKNNTGTETIEGISVDMSNLRELHLSPTVFLRMHNLRILKVFNRDEHKKKCKVYLSEDLLSLPENLRYLHWETYPSRNFPTNFRAEFLVELIMPNSQAEKLWSGVQDLGNLKKVDLSYSENLMDIPDFSRAKNLENVYLEYCRSLKQIPSHFQNLGELKTLYLEGCSSLDNFPELPRSIICLVLNETGIKEVPSSIDRLYRLKILTMRNCKRLMRLSTNICKLKSLNSLSLSGCSSLEEFPEVLEPMISLTVLELDGTSFEEIPNSVKNLIGINNNLNVEMLEHLRLIPCTSCKLDFPKCLSFRSSQDHPLYISYNDEKGCSSAVEVVSISRRELMQGFDHFKMRGQEFVFFNCLRFPRRSERIGDDPTGIKSFHRKIEHSKVKRGFQKPDFGIFCQGNEIPKWFRYLKDDEIPTWFPKSCIKSSIRIKLGRYRLRSIFGFALCAVVEFNDKCPKWRDFKLLCQPHYVLSNGSMFSWDLHWNNIPYSEVIDVPHIFETSFTNSQYPYKDDLFIRTFDEHKTIVEAVFDLWCVDENYEPIKDCIIKKCGIHILYVEGQLLDEEDITVDDEVNECEPSGRGSMDFDTKQEAKDELSGYILLETIASISSQSLAERLSGSTLLLYNFVEMHERVSRDRMANADDESFPCEYRAALTEFKNGFLDCDHKEDVGASRLGDEIPNWFSYQSEGSSTRIKLPPTWLHNNSFLGFALCAVVDFDHYYYFSQNQSRNFKLLCHLKSWDLFSDNGCIIRSDVVENLISNDRIVAVTFEFMCVDENCRPLAFCTVKKCGIRFVYAEEIIGLHIDKSIRESEEHHNDKFENMFGWGREKEVDVKQLAEGYTIQLEAVCMSSKLIEHWSEFEDRRFLFRNFLDLHAEIHRNNATSRAKLEFFRREIASQHQRGHLAVENIGAHLGNEVLDWFSYQPSSIINVTLPNSPTKTFLVPFAVCAALDFKAIHPRRNFFKFMWRRRPNYGEKSAPFLSWNFYADVGHLVFCDVDHDEFLRFLCAPKFQHYFAHEDPRDEKVHGNVMPNIADIYTSSSFDLWCVDENSQLLQGWDVAKCGFGLLYGEQIGFIGRYIWESKPQVKVVRSTKDVVEASGSGD